ncbi:MAG: hypothetical protein AMK71_12580 [Nitrospira bacterium SG8_35_4]|nr:MAG: hypothetical protein AMK71_12580 [Nitrospira bacterium SG8_35_4]
MNLCRAYPVFIILSVVIGWAIAHFRNVPVLYGISIGMSVGMAPLFLLGIIYALMMAWRPDRPMCRCGKCQSEDYEFVWREEIPVMKKTIYEFRCPSCSRTYRKKDKRFWEVSSDGSETPFMVISKWGRWQIENTEPPIHSS